MLAFEATVLIQLHGLQWFNAFITSGCVCKCFDTLIASGRRWSHPQAVYNLEVVNIKLKSRQNKDEGVQHGAKRMPCALEPIHQPKRTELTPRNWITWLHHVTSKACIMREKDCHMPKNNQVPSESIKQIHVLWIRWSWRSNCYDTCHDIKSKVLREYEI
jgi:hypothetical protein